MGSSHNRIRTYDLAARCCHGAFYAVGCLTTILIFMAILWIVWCYLGLSLVQVSTGQRRALVNYSFTTAKPQTSTSSNQTTSVDLNTISKSAMTTTSSSSFFQRGGSRGESQLKHDPDRKDISRGNSSWAKGDFASRNRAPPAAKDISIASTATPLQSSISGDGKTKDAVPSVEIKDDAIKIRRIPSSIDNLHGADELITNKDVLDKENPSITPMKVHDPVLGSNIAPIGDVSRDDMRTPSREYPKPEGSSSLTADEIKSSRRSDADSMSRVPSLDADSPRPYVRERTKYDDDEDRGSRSRYDTRDRGRDPTRYIDDDRYSKGDTKLRPEGSRGRTSEERYSDDRYEDLPRRRGDGDRVRDSDDRYIYRDEIPRYKEDDPRYVPRDTRYDDRDEERYRARDEDRYRARGEDRYRARDDSRYRLRNDKNDRSREDDKYRTRYDDRDESIIDERDRLKIDGRQRPRIDDRDRPIISDRDRPILSDRDIPIIDDRGRPSIVDRDRTIINDRPIISDGVRPLSDDRVKIDGRDVSRIDDRKDSSTILEPERSRIDDDRYRPRVESIDRPRVDDRYEIPDEDRDKSREYRRRGEDRDILRDEDDYRSRVESRRRIPEDKLTEERLRDTKYSERRRYIPREEEDRYKDDPRTIKRDYRDPVIDGTDALPPLERSPLPVRKISDVRGDRDGTEYDYPTRGSVRSDSDGLTRTILTETRRRDRDDEYRRPSRYDDRDRISPSRVKDDTYSTSLDSRPRPEIPLPVLSGSRYRDRYPEDSTRVRDTKYYDDEDRKRIPSSLDGSSRRVQGDDRREYKTRLPGETKYNERGEEVFLDRRSYASEEDDDYRDKPNSRTGSYEGKSDTRLRGDDDEYDRRSRPDDDAEYSRRRKYDADDDSEYSRRRTDDDEEYRRERPRGDYDASRTRPRDSYDEYTRDDDRYGDDRPVRRYDEIPRNRDEPGLRKDERPHRNIDARPPPALDRIYPLPKADEAPVDVSRSTNKRDPVPPSGSGFEERPLNVKDVIQAASRHSHNSDAMRKVSYPVFDPRVSNLTSPDVIRPSERRGSTILSRRKRRLITGV